MLAIAFFSINPCTKFKVHSFTPTKDMIGAKKIKWVTLP